MADPRGFLKHGRQTPSRRPVGERLADWGEVYEPPAPGLMREQAQRCMDCGVPFCHHGCPVGNRIPEWNDLVRRGDWREASEQLHATNNFPELTGRMCPAPCESSCVLSLGDEPVTIKSLEQAIVDRAWAEGWVTPAPPRAHTGRRVAVVGSGPAGLAAAQQLGRVGHAVTVFERSDRIGGLLRYGIPDFKMDKALLDRRLGQLAAEGVRFVTGVDVGTDLPTDRLRAEHDAVVVAVGALHQRELPLPGRDLPGVHLAMEYLERANRVQAGGRAAPEPSAAGRHVVVIGGGDTGADCHGTALRQGACSVTQLQIHPRPPTERDQTQPWPTVPFLFTVSPAHEEGGRRMFAVNTEAFVADEQGRVRALVVTEGRRVDGRWQEVPGSRREIRCDLALIAVGFAGTEPMALVDRLGLTRDPAGLLVRNPDYSTDAEGVFVAGDAGRGASLIVWAIAEGRAAAAAADAYLTGRTSLPAPVPATARPLRL